METFGELKAIVNNPNYHNQRQNALAVFDPQVIDAPIADLISDLNKLPCCFTLQSCYGHFLYEGQDDTQNLDPLPLTSDVEWVEYRIAYIALVIENSDAGRFLINSLREIPQIDEKNIQFGCADWFWSNQVNSFALQVEPEEHKYKDRAWIRYNQARRVEEVRQMFFDKIRELLFAFKHR